MLRYWATDSILFILTKTNSKEKIPDNFFKDEFQKNIIKNNIEEIHVNGYISSIGTEAFMNIPTLKKVKINSEVICCISRDSFSNNPKLEIVEMNDNVLSLGPLCFANCPELSRVKFSESLSIIGYKAFANDASLINIRIPHTVDYCDDLAFDGTIIGRSDYFKDIQRSIECRNNSIYTTTPAGLHYQEVSKYKKEL